MKINFIAVIILYACNGNGQSQLNFSLILNHLNNFNVKLCHFLTCWNKHENVELAKLMMAANIRISFLESGHNAKTALLEKNSVTYYSYVVDLTCENMNLSFLNENMNEFNLRMSHPWLMFMQSLPDFSEWKSLFNNITLRMDSNVKLAVSTKVPKTFTFFDIYNPGSQIGEKPVITEYGFWNGSDLIINKRLKFYQQRKDMTSIQLRSGSVVLIQNHTGTFEEYMLDSKHTEFDTMSKFHYPMFLLLMDVHNFTHTLQVEDKWFGNYQNGTDDGVGKLLYENKIDITCTGASQRPPRVDVYDYLMPSYHFRPCYVFRNPGTYNPLSNEFLKPFDSTVWYIVLVVAALICISLQVLHRNESKFEESPRKYSWSAAILTTFSVIFQQDASAFPTGSGGRIAFLVLQIWSILLYNYYTSSIISSLLSKPPNAFHTLDELGRSKLEIGIEDLPYTLTWFEIMNDSDVQYIYKNKVFPPGAKKLNIYEPEEGIAKVGKGGFAYHTQLDTGYPIISRTFDQDAICDITEIPMIPQVEAGIMVQKKSQYKELFHLTLRRIKEVGLIYRISQIWEAKKPECLSSAKVVAVGFNQVFIAFLILFIGMMISLLLLLVEIGCVFFNLDIKLLANTRLQK